MIKRVSKRKNLKGEIIIPADKSISHRAVMFSAIARGESIIRNFSSGADCHSTLNLFKQLGVKAEFLNDKTIQIEGVTNVEIYNNYVKALNRMAEAWKPFFEPYKK